MDRFARSWPDRFPLTEEGTLELLDFACHQLHSLVETKRSPKYIRFGLLQSYVDDKKRITDEAVRRLDLLKGLPPAAVERVKSVLSREFAAGTIERIHELLVPAVEALREAREEARLAGRNGESPAAGMPPEAEVKPTKPKRSTERGEAREKLIAALTKHHQYADGGCLNLEHIGNNELARLAQIGSNSTASAFFRNEFGGHDRYRALCSDPSRLAAAMKALRGEFRPRDFLLARTPEEVEAEQNE
jgi:hypothetical protein